MLKLIDTHIFTALITPFTDDGVIDYDSLDLLIAEQVRVGNGFVLLGSTGESLALTFQEKYNILQHVCKKNLSVPILAGVGGFNLKEILDWLKLCESLPLDGYLMVTPIYMRPGFYGQLKWFRCLLDAVSKPCMLYNVPARTGCSLAIEVLSELNEHPNLWALKEASGSIEQFCAYYAVAPKIAFYSGNDNLMPSLAMKGASGLVSVMGNVWPEATMQYVRLSLQKDVNVFMDDNILLPAICSVNNRNPVSVKVLLYALGKISSIQLRAPLSEQDGSSKDELLRQHFEVEKWLNMIKGGK